MPGIETAVASAGKAIAERAVREWLTIRAADRDRKADLTELIRVSFRDRIVRRKLEHQITGVALAVEDRLGDLLEREFRGLDADARSAVLLEVVDALRAADLTDTALLATDADPAALTERITAALPAPKLGAAEDRLFAILLAECVECLVGMVRELPQFLPRAATESLTRLSGLAESMERLLARMPVRSLDAPEGSQDDAAFEHRYLAFVSRTLDEVELFGVRVENFRPRTSLSVAYISLSVSTGERRPWGQSGPLEFASLRDHAESKDGTHRIESALGRSRLTLVRGDAGSGKSTLLRWLAVTAARGGFAGDLADWNGCVPFVIKLRSHSEGRFPPPESFLDDMAQEVAGQMPRGWVERVLASGRGLLLVDGVDELLVKHRPTVRQWLTRLLTLYPALRVVVTSRPTAAEATWLADEGFSSALLEPMAAEDLRELVRQWHMAMRDCPSLPCETSELEEYEGSLLARLESNPHLRVLASTPLLAAMLCALNLDRRRHLPRSRMGLYEAVLTLLLERRDAERGIEDEVALDPEQKVWILRDLAWRLVSLGRSELSKATARKRIEQKLRAMTRMPYPAEVVLEHLLRRSGVLREPIPGRVDFAHRTVQEYLAAGQLVEDEDVELAVERAHLDQWREVVVMTAGHATGGLRRELLASLLDRADQGGRYARRLRLLVASCLETIQEIPLDLGDRVEACLESVIPPRNEEEARLLAAVGEEVLKRLPDDLSHLSGNQAAMVVRTTWLINGTGALDKLARYAADGRPPVQGQLVAGWKYFDAVRYARHVLAGAPLSERVYLDSPRLLRGLPHLRRVRHLAIDRACQVPDLAFLHGKSELRGLEIYHAAFPHLTEVGSLDNLEELYVHFHAPKLLEVTPLKRLRKLKILRLSDVLSADGLDYLDEVAKLSGLSLSFSEWPDDPVDLGPLSRQNGVRALSLAGVGQPVDPTMLPPLVRQLALVSVDGVIGGLAAIADRFPDLSSLHIIDVPGTFDLAELSRVTLHTLQLGNLTDLTGFDALTRQRELRFLHLKRLPISDLTPLAELPNVRILSVTDCPRVTDLSPLASMPALEDVRLHHTSDRLDLGPFAHRHRLTIQVAADQEVLNEHRLHSTTRVRRSPA
ncbi:NACHT domain-containing protein [Microtetraspora malaysiensis]|uniref:NACHT domain-containing protein n=1 Tax=Microtetraspora malaysiensis TaxID=161358 RepID=UPI003D907F15